MIAEVERKTRKRTERTGPGPSFSFWVKPVPIPEPVPIPSKPWIRMPQVGAHMFGEDGLLDPVG